MTQGSDLMNQLSRGELTFKSSAYALSIKMKISTALTELITFGARVRPLILEGERVGWIRPFSFSEKKQIDIWFDKEEDKVKYLLQLCTTLPLATIENLDMVELNSILRILTQGHLADLSLVPYLTSFVTTQSSMGLWHTRNDSMFKPKEFLLPDGSKLSQLLVADHISIWASLCAMREAAILRTEASINAAVIARSFGGGESWTSYLTNLQKTLQAYSMDNMDTWMNTIDFVSYNAKEKDLGDGFGHSHEDASTEGLMREMQGMLEGDKHEQLIQHFYDQQLAQEKAAQDKQRALILARREALKTESDIDSSLIVRTEREVQEREREIREQNYGWVNRENQKMFDQNDSEDATDVEKIQRLSQYL